MPKLLLNGSEPSAMYLGGTKVSAAYLGGEKVWPLKEPARNTITATYVGYGEDYEVMLISSCLSDSNCRMYIDDVEVPFTTSAALSTGVHTVRFEISEALASTYYMFDSCTDLKTVDLSGFDTSSLTDTSWMFIYCSALTNVNLSGFDTSKVTNMSGMFYGCGALTSSVVNTILSSLITTAVTDISYMFASCIGITSVAISNRSGVFVTSMVENIGYMFADCTALASVEFGVYSDLRRVNDFTHMFFACEALSSVSMLGAAPDASSPATLDMFYGVQYSGIFTYNPAYDYNALIAHLPSNRKASPR